MYWEDRLAKAKAAGLDAIQMWVSESVAEYWFLYSFYHDYFLVLILGTYLGTIMNQFPDYIYLEVIETS